MSEFEEFATDLVSVRPKLGSGGMGAVYGPPVFWLVQADEKRQLVRSADGQQVVSSATLYDEDLTHDYPLDSEVVLPSGRVARVIMCARMSALGADLPAHLEVTLT